MQNNFSVPELSKSLYQNDPKKIIPDDIVSYVAEKIEYVPYEGIMLYIQGASYPKRGFPTPEAIAAINIVKQILFQAARFPVLFACSKDKLVQSFNALFVKCFTPYMLKREYLCPTAYNVMLFIENFLVHLNVDKTLARDCAYYLAHIIEYDDAYRYRLQDIISETTHYQLTNNPKKDILRLLDILHVREGGDKAAYKKAGKIIKAISYMLLIPSYRKAFIQAMTPETLLGMQYTVEDEYWARLKGDLYLYTGKTYEERTEGLLIPQAYKITMN